MIGFVLPAAFLAVQAVSTPAPPGPLPEAGRQSSPALAVTHARVYPVSSEPIPDGTVVVEDGRIVAVGPADQVDVPADARIVDARGGSLIPGIVESHSHMGFKQLWRPTTGSHNNEMSASINARVRAVDGLNTSDVAFERALAGGITTMNITPGSRSPNSGQAVVVKLRAPTVEEMEIAHGGMKFAIRGPWRSSTFDGTEEEVADLLASQLGAARAYLEAKRAHRAGEREEAPPEDLTLEAFGKLLTGEWPVGVHAHHEEAMRQAIRLAEDFDLDLYVHHADATHALVDELAEAEIPISFGPVLPFIGRNDEELDGPVELARAGGLVAFHQDHPDGPQYYLRESAALFVRRGMPEAEALKALTLNPARILRVDDRVGSLEPGKDGDLVLLSGPPLDWESRVRRVWVEGREVWRGEMPGDAAAASGAERPGSRGGSMAGSARGASAGESMAGSAADADLAVVGGEVRPVTGPAISDGVVLVRDGRIVAVGPASDVEVPADAEVVDASGRIVTPGFLDARTTVGREGRNPWGPETTETRPTTLVEAAAAVEDHPWVADGVTAVYAAPTARGLVGGFGGVVKLAGGAEDRVVRERAGLAVSFGDRAIFSDDGTEPTTRQGMIGLLRQRLHDVRDGPGTDHPRPAPEYEHAGTDAQLRAVLDGEVPLRVLAHTADDVVTAVRVAREFDLELVVDGAAGGHAVAPELAAAGARVVAGPAVIGVGGGGSVEMMAHTPENAARLHGAGVPIALSTGSAGGRSVAVEAAVARAHGLPADAALRAITLDAARILGVEDRLGSLEPEKDADLVLWEGDPVGTWGRAGLVIVDGEVVYRR